MPVTVNTIFCPVDLSDYSAHVLLWARMVAKRSNAFLVIFHAVLRPRERLALSVPRPDVQDLIYHARNTIQEAMAGYEGPWEACVLEGDPVHLTATLARKYGADVIITASHGLSGVKRMVLGSVVERMAREISMPILVLRCQDLPFMGGIKSADTVTEPECRAVVAACDLTPRSASIVDSSYGFARLLGARLFLVHSIESPVQAEEGLIEDSYAIMQERLQQSLRKKLLSRLPAETGTGSGDPGNSVPVEAVVLTGNPAEEITNFSLSIKADLMVVGVRHRTILGKLFTGSTTEAMIRSAPCHVLAVPESMPDPSQVMERIFHA
ncbi:MAG: universal stress protein [Pseudomonadota bacterium]